MNVIQLNSSALKTTSLGKEILLNEVLGHFRQFFTPRHSLRMGWNNTSYKTKELKEEDLELYARLDRFGINPNVVREEQQPYSPPPDWFESRSILKASGTGVSSLIIADNNLGLVSIYGDRYKILSHKLHVRAGREMRTKIHETIVELGFY
jgi:hypothetical protein